jgi:hypothetical protein
MLAVAPSTTKGDNTGVFVLNRAPPVDAESCATSCGKEVSGVEVAAGASAESVGSCADV